MRRSFYLCACGQVFAGRQMGGHRAKGGCMKKYRPIPKAEYKRIQLELDEVRQKQASLPVRPVKPIARQYPEEIEVISKRLAELKGAYDAADDNFQAAEQELEKAKNEYADFKAGLQRLMAEVG